MSIAYTHILVITIHIPQISQNDMNSYPLEKLLEPDLLHSETGIKKVIHYGNILFCLFNADSNFTNKVTPEQKTEALNPLILDLFQNPNIQVEFNWMMHEKNNLDVQINPLVATGIGSSGGSSLGSRGGD